MTLKKYDDKEEGIKTENKKEKQLIAQEKLNHGSLEIHACSIQGITEGPSKRRKGLRQDMPYVPSMKSMPSTSSSDFTLPLNFKDKTVHKLVDKCSKKILKPIQNNKDNIRKLSRKNYVFGDLKNHISYNEISSDIEGNNTITSFNLDFSPEDQTQMRVTNIKHSYPTKITDTINSMQTITESNGTDSIFASQLSNSSLSNELGMSVSTPKLTINQQKALDGPLNNKVAEHNTESLNPSKHVDTVKNQALSTNNEKGKFRGEKNEIIKQSSYEHRKTRYKKKQTTLVLFDCNKYPLTDSQGKILKTAAGKNLVKYRNGKPYDCFGRAVFDSSGNSSASPHFKPYSNVLKNRNIISAIPLFDFRGYCLINYDGSSLINADGKNLIQVDMEGKILYDINKHPIFDKHGIPVTKQNGFWFLPTGIPLRLFDKTNHPLTNKHGESLHDIKDTELLKCDQYGRPVLDLNDVPVFDASGTSAEEPKFNPSSKPSQSPLVLILKLENKPAQLYDKRGWPLTEKSGEVMNDSNGHCLIMLKKVNPNEITDYDQWLFRLNEPIPLTEICLYLPETKLQPEDGYINIKDQDEIKEQRKIVLDFVGHPLSDRFKDNVFDKSGRRIFLNIKSYFIGINNGPSSTTVCISDGTFTIKTWNSSQAIDSQRKQDTSLSADVISFQTETDLFGRPLYDSFNRPLFDKYGRPIYDLFGRPIYDPMGRPIASSEAKRLDNGLDESPGKDIGFKISCLIPQDPNKLPKITDLNGGPLFDSLGFPLYNQKGKPLIDAYGRQLYDENGFLLCDEEGRPVSKLVKQRKTQISSVEDIIEMLQLTPIESQTKKHLFSVGKSNQYQTIHETAKRQKNEDIKKYRVMKNFIARIRITTFSDGEKYFEILESVPCL